MTPDRIVVWLPPAEEHEAWRELTGYDMSRERLESHVAEIVARPGGANINPMSVHTMRERLADGQNTPARRAEIVAGPCGLTLGMSIAADADGGNRCVGWAMLGPQRKSGRQAVGDGGVAEAITRIMAQLRG